MIFGNLSKNISEKMEMGKTAKMKNAEKKTDILTRVVSTVVFTNSVFCVSLITAFVAENTIKIGVSVPPPKPPPKKNNKILKFKSDPS